MAHTKLGVAAVLAAALAAGVPAARAGEDETLDGPAVGAERLSKEEFEKLHALIKVRPGEGLWDELPWETSLWKAREKAAREGKMLLLWQAAAGGVHALGST